MTLNDKDEVTLVEKSNIGNPWKWEQFNLSTNPNAPIRHTVYSSPPIKGFLCSQTVYPEAEIQNICVHQAHRRKNIASALLNEFINWCQDHKFDKIFLEVREQNTPAQNLYQKFEFKPMDIRKNYYSSPPDHAHLYELRLH